MKSRSDSERPLPPMEVLKAERDPATFRTTEADAVPFRKAEDDGYARASALFDEAMEACRVTNQEAAYLVSVSESLVQKWRSAESHACPSFAQMLRLPPAFHLELYRAMNRRYGFGRAALARLLEAAGDLALVVER